MTIKNITHLFSNDKTPKSKYRNMKCSWEGIFKNSRTVLKFDSQKEMNRFHELRIMQIGQKIFNLDVQKTFVLQDSFVNRFAGIQRKITYKADFYYIENNREIVEDVKPFCKKTNKFLTTKDFNIKRKLFLLKYPNIDFRII